MPSGSLPREVLGRPKRYGQDEGLSSSSNSSNYSRSVESLGSVPEVEPASLSQSSVADPGGDAACLQASPAGLQRGRLQQLSILLPEQDSEAQGLMQGDASFVLDSAGAGRQARRSRTPAPGGRTPSDRLRAALR